MNGNERHFEKALAALLATGTFGEAAAQVGIAESTLRRWAQQPEFAAAYQQARRQVLEAALASISAAAGKAVQTLVRLLDGPPNSAVRAAGLILDHAERGAELLDLNARLEQLEARFPLADARHPGAPPKNVKDRVRRIEARAPFGGCTLCADSDPETLAQALLNASPDGEPLAEHCPQCGAEINDLTVRLTAVRLRAGCLISPAGAA